MDAAKLIIEVTGGDASDQETSLDVPRYERPTAATPPPLPPLPTIPRPERPETAEKAQAAFKLPAPTTSDEQKQAILESPGAKKFGFDATSLGKLQPAVIEHIYKGLAPRPTAKQEVAEAAGSGSGTATPKNNEFALERTTQQRLIEIRNAIREMPTPSVPKGGGSNSEVPRRSTPTAKAEAAPKSEAPAKDTYGFKDAKDRVEAGPTYDVKPAEARPPRLPRANPVAKDEVPALPRAKVIDGWAGWKNGESLKNFLPSPIAKNFDAIKGGYTTASAEAGASGAGAAGRVAAGIGGAAAAAGPLAVLAVVELAAGQMAKAINRSAANIELLGKGAAQFAGNDHLGMMNTAVEHVTESLEEIPIVGKVYAAEVRYAVAPIKALTMATNAFVERGKQLAGYNGVLAGANAAAEVRSFKSDVNEARVLGAGLARLTDSSSKIENQMREFLLPLKEAFVNGLAEVVTAIADNSTEITTAVARFADGPVAALAGIVGPFERALDAYREEVAKRKADASKDAGPILDWLDAAKGLGQPFQQVPQNVPRPMGPIFPQGLN